MEADQPPAWVHQRRRSVPYFPEADAPRRVESDPSGYMFVEDIGLGILPYEVSGREYSVRLDPGDFPEETVASLFPSHDERLSNGLRDKIAAFIEEVTRGLAHRGELWFETVRPPANEVAPSPAFALQELPPGRVTRIPGWLIQHVPRASRGRIGKRFINIPSRDAWHVTIPAELGTPSEHRALIEFLGRTSFPPPFSTEVLAPGNDPKGYDFTRHKQVHQASIAYATRRWGWPARGMWEEESSEYFAAYRFLRFRRAQCSLRDHILNQMNALLRGEGIRATIITEGLAKPGEIDSMLRQLESGTATYADALALLRR
jgi:hypothetical protein